MGGREGGWVGGRVDGWEGGRVGVWEGGWMGGRDGERGIHGFYNKQIVAHFLFSNFIVQRAC